MSDIASPAPSSAQSPLATEVARRRTFAIISHPDAGKTALTGKLLPVQGAINPGGQVKAKRRTTRSDCMKIEREHKRGFLHDNRASRGKPGRFPRRNRRLKKRGSRPPCG